MSVKVAVNPSSQSRPIDTGDPDCSWGKMCAVLAVGDKRGFRFSNYLWVACMRLLSVSITWGVIFYRIVVAEGGVDLDVVLGCTCVVYAVVF